jgi:aldose 1-epimerase
VWEVVSVTDDSATLGLSLPDGLGGFPGNRRVEARFSLTGRATLRLDCRSGVGSDIK